MEVLIKPIITEKMTSMGEKFNRYGFVVDSRVNKIQVKVAVEKMYGVTVNSVNVINYVGKIKTRNTTKGVVSGRVNKNKKAIVTLKKGETIDFYSGI
ncbi:MAG TPA: 50S ribosomal protein L23 [Bacteroidia bacterium]|nr:50S ribosomal protein L23 [Bacteroidia bacterium]